MILTTGFGSIKKESTAFKALVENFVCVKYLISLSII